MKLRWCASVALFSAALTSYAGDAAACGGCFIPPSESTVVTGHRMALSVSTTQTVLWDQIQYSGDPADFAWVLPVKPGAVIEVSTDAWFEALEQGTIANVIAPPITCPTPPRLGCSAFLSEAANVGGEGDPSSHVTVLHEGAVGPYDTVTLMADQQGVLNDWLSAHGYNVDPSAQPIIDAYVAEGFNFIALRLQPDQGVQQMKPVRIVTQGASAALPLRMVAAGTGPEVAITLFVISEARHQVDGFTNTTIDNDFLAWDFVTNTSNFAELRNQVLKENGGATWLTAYAERRPFFEPPSDPLSGGTYGFSQTTFISFNTLADVYFDKGLTNGEIDALCPNVATQFTSAASSTDKVTNPCAPGVPLDDPSCGSVPAGQTDSRLFACGALDDFAVALNGLHPKDVWLTRVEANLPRAHLANDLTLSPAEEQRGESNYHQATIAVNTESFCPSAGPALLRLGDEGDPAGRGGDKGMWFGAGAFGLALLAAARRLIRARARKPLAV